MLKGTLNLQHAGTVTTEKEAETTANVAVVAVAAKNLGPCSCR